MLAPDPSEALLDRDLRVLHASEALAGLAGLPAPAARGRRLRDLLPAGAAPEVEAVARRALRAGGLAEGTVVLPPPVGRWQVRARPTAEGVLVAVEAERAEPFGPGPAEDRPTA